MKPEHTYNLRLGSFPFLHDDATYTVTAPYDSTRDHLIVDCDAYTQEEYSLTFEGFCIQVSTDGLKAWRQNNQLIQVSSLLTGVPSEPAFTEPIPEITARRTDYDPDFARITLERPVLNHQAFEKFMQATVQAAFKKQRAARLAQYQKCAT